MLRLEKRPQPSGFWSWLTPLIAVVITMVAGGLLFGLLGKPPVEAIRCGSRPHSPAFERTNWRARAESVNDAGAIASCENRYVRATTEIPESKHCRSRPGLTPLLPARKPPPWIESNTGVGLATSAFQKSSTLRACGPYLTLACVGATRA